MKQRMSKEGSVIGRAKRKSSRPVVSLGACFMAAGALVMGYPAPSMAADLAQSGVIHLEYKEGAPRVVPGFRKSHGKYLGSGIGSVEGAVTGSVSWDLYEDQSDPTFCRAQFVGRITASDGSSASFETAGYFLPRTDGEQWDVTSAVYFGDAKGTAYRELAHQIGLWQGQLEFGSDTVSHSYTLYLPTSNSAH